MLTDQILLLYNIIRADVVVGADVEVNGLVKTTKTPFDIGIVIIIIIIIIWISADKVDNVNMQLLITQSLWFKKRFVDDLGKLKNGRRCRGW